jgi:hypothetical protein
LSLAGFVLRHWVGLEVVVLVAGCSLLLVRCRPEFEMGIEFG